MHPIPFVLRLGALALAALASACATAPAGSASEALPALAPPAPFAAAPSLPRAAPAVQPPGADWSALGDPQLSDWVRRGLAANLDLEQAAARVQRSRALAAGARAERGPSLHAGLGARAQQLSQSQAPGMDLDTRRSQSASAGLDLSWEIDLFSRLAHQAGAADARVAGALADAQALQLAVGAELAHAWYALAGARERLQITQSVIDNRRATLSLVQRRQALGYSAPLDEARARADLAAAEAERPMLEAEAATATHRLAVLTGESPSRFAAPEVRPLDPVAVRLEVPEPARWLAARPDLRAAEARLRAQALNVEAVRAEFLPRLSLNGFLGFVAGAASGLGAAGSAAWFVAPSLSVPLFDHGRIEARLDAARAEQREALAHYRQRLLLAIEEVENALTLVEQGRRQLLALHERSLQAARAEALARRRFEAGASDLLELLDAQRSAQQAQIGLAAALTQQRQQVVGLLRAFGTGAPVSLG